jgi:hypothetical protein
MENIERITMISGFVRALVRHRMSDTRALIPVEEIDRITTKADRAFVLRLLRLAAPLYPLPPSEIRDSE